MARRLGAVLFGVAGLLTIAAAGCSKAEGTASGKPAVNVAIPEGATKIVVDGKGFTPSEVHVEKGKPATLAFVRTTDATCANKVVFPELKLEKDLPLDTAVAINVPTDRPRTLTFQCGMGMFQSSVVIQ